MIQQMRSDIMALRSEVARLRRTTIEGMNRAENSGGVTFATGVVGTSRTLYADKFVAIVRAPVATDRMLLVREMKYAGDSPSPCQTIDSALTCYYQWADLAFDAFPVFGSTAMDYAGDFTTAAETAASPPADTTVLRCFRNHDSWIVEPTAAINRRLVVINPNFSDTILCGNKVDSIEKFHVAKPYLLRRSPFDGYLRDGIEFAYTSNTERTAIRRTPAPPEGQAAPTENQRLIPKYLAGDVIVATTQGLGAADELITAPGTAIVKTKWIDKNADAREWAKV